MRPERKERDVDVELTGLCADHSFEAATEVCRRCGFECCEICVVYPFGAKKPLCKECAMVEGGVRAHSPRPAAPGRLIRKRASAFAKRTAAKTGKRPDMAEIVDPVLQDWMESTPDEPEREPAPVAVAETPRPTEVDATIEPGTDLTPTAPPGEEPADGVAPPIDWNKPFG